MADTSGERQQLTERVLVVDDDTTFRIYLSGFIQELGYDVLEAKGGEEGLEIFRRERPQAVLLDLRMPGMDGLEVLGAVVEESPLVPVIVVSGEGDMEDAIKALRMGAWDYVVKSPRATATLAEVLAEALNRSLSLQNRHLYSDSLQSEVSKARRSLVEFRQRLEAEMDKRRRAEKNLEEERSQVQGMTVTLKNVIRTVEQDKQEYKADLGRQLEERVLPALERMVAEDSRDMRRRYKDLVVEQLAAIAGGDKDLPGAELVRLTPTELEVCEYIKTGRSTSEVADLMNTSLDTVQTHRKNIRRKLGLVGEKVSLHAYLRSLSQNS